MLQINIEKMMEKLASYCGYDNQFSKHTNIEEIADEVREKTKKFHAISSLLSYKYFDEENAIFISDDSYHSVLLRLNSLVGIDSNKAMLLENLISNELPQNSYLNFLLVASSNIKEPLDLWKNEKNMEHKLVRKIVSEREEFIEKKSSNFSSESKIIPRNFDLYLSYTRKINSKSEYTKFKNFVRQLVAKMGNLDLHPRFCNCEDLIEVIGEILEIDRISEKREGGKYRENIIIKDQVTTPLYRHDIVDDRILHPDPNLTSKLYFARSFPKEFSLKYMIKLLGDDTLSSNIIPGRFIISYIISNDIGIAESNSIIQKGNRIISAAEEWYSRNNRNIKREASEWREVNDKAKNGETFLTEFFQIMLTCDSEHIDQAEQNLFSLYQSLDWKIEVNKFFTLPALLTIMPMQAHLFWRDLKFFKLSKVALSSEVAAKLPIHGEWKGVPKSGMLLMGRRGQIFQWNPFYRMSSGNYNICIFGPSGSGKSVLLQELAVNLIAQDTKVFILDIGRSFNNICSLLGGEIVEFSQDSNIALNPFSQFSDDLSEEDRNIAILYAKSIICSMCSVIGDSLKESIIEKTIIKALNEYGTSLDITKFSEILGDSDCEVRKNLSLSLFSYTKDGLYGKFFSRKDNGVKFENDITIFEFEEIKNNKLLLSVILQIIGMQIFMQVLTGDRRRKFLLIVDEAWMILENSAKFLAEFARTIRKYGGSLAVCVQNYADLEGDEHRRAILQNSTWTILLKQDEKGINSFKDSEAFKDIVPLIKSLSIQKDLYAELLIYSTGIKVVGRLILDNFSKILYSTDAENFSKINNLQKEGKSLEQAIEIISEEVK